MNFYKSTFLFLLIGLFYFQHINSVQAQSSEQGLEFSLANLNCWGLNIWIPGIKRNKRYPKLIHLLDSLDADVLTLQECFHKKLRKKLKKTFANEYNFGVDVDCNQGGILKKDCNGGLVTLSKYPIIESNFYPFTKMEGMKYTEKVGKKGFVVSKLDINGTIVYVTNTHLYAGRKDKDEKHRFFQSSQISEFILTNFKKFKKIVLCGDLNTEYPTLTTAYADSKIHHVLTSEINFEDYYMNNELIFTYDSTSNEYVHKMNKGKLFQHKFDYILYKNLHCKSQNIIGDNPDVSDHFGLIAIFY